MKKTVSAAADLRARHAREAPQSLAIEALQTSIDRLRIEAERAADVSTWPGHGVRPEDYTNPMRRARFKTAKISAATHALLVRQQAALDEALGEPEAEPDYTDAELDEIVATAKAEAAEWIDRLAAQDRLNVRSSPAAERPSAKLPSSGRRASRFSAS